MTPGLRYDDASHRYWLGARELPSVTTLLAHYGILAPPDAPPHRLEFARERGSAVHLAIRFANEGTLDPASVDPQIAGYLFAWDAFTAVHHADVEPLPEWIERPLADATLGLAGTPDLAARVRGVVSVVDVKCTFVLHPAVGVQLAAYRLLLRAAGVPVVRRFAVQLRPDGTFRLREYRDPMDEQEVRAALLLHHRRAARKGAATA